MTTIGTSRSLGHVGAARSASDPGWPRHGGTTSVDEEAEFESADEAIAWGRERAGLVLVRLGYSAEAMYSAGERHAAWFIDGSGWRFPLWPPASWPDYTGPPEPGWPEFEAPEGDD